uniref:hypothetical protein n=1 Tax=uncultured Treponema sp. TaxID=162155 RepID=UPI0025D6CAAF
MDFYEKFYDYCKKVVDVWKNEEFELLNDYENNRDYSCFYNKMNEETNNYQELILLRKNFLQEIEQRKIFKEKFKSQKNYANTKDFSQAIFNFQFYLTDGNKQGIRFRVFSNYPK